jgi:hypothetical protein
MLLNGKTGAVVTSSDKDGRVGIKIDDLLGVKSLRRANLLWTGEFDYGILEKVYAKQVERLAKECGGSDIDLLTTLWFADGDCDKAVADIEGREREHK